jgi:hypothetical protein
MDNKIQEGLNSIDRVKLLMGYSLSKTLTENKESILIEQSVYVKNADGSYTLKSGPYNGVSADKVYPNGNYPKTLPKDFNFNQENPFNTQPKVNTVDNNWKKSYQDAHPDKVWDPNVTRNEQYWDSQGNIHTKKVKTGGFVDLTPENMGLRGTPFGFHPEEYPEYLKKVKEIEKKYPDEESHWYNPTTWFDSDTDDARNKALSNLKAQYYHSNFPSGIKRQDYLDWLNTKKSLSSQQNIEMDSIRKSFSSSYKTPKDMPGSDYFLDVHNSNIRNIENSSMSQVYGKYKSLGDYMDAIYEYDPYSIKELSKGSLEKWWDENGAIAEFALWVLADILTDGAVAYLGETRQMYLLAKIVKFAGKVGLPVAVGTYDTIKNGHLTEEGIIDFMFAVLPWAHAKFGIKSTPSVQLVESIVSKKNGLNLRMPDDVRKFMKLLTQEEKSLFRQVTKLTKSQKENGIKAVMKELESKGLKRVYNTAKTVKKTTGQVIKPSNLIKAGKFLVTMAKDLTGIEIAKILASKLGLLDAEKKEKILAEEFNKRKGTDLLILMANAAKVIKENPKLDANGIITKSLEQNFAKTAEQAVNIMIELNLSEEILVDKNGKPVKL